MERRFFENLVPAEISGKKKGGMHNLIGKFPRRNVIWKIDSNRSERTREGRDLRRSVEKRRAKKHVGDI